MKSVDAENILGWKREARPHARVIFRQGECYPTPLWMGIRAQDLTLAAASLGYLPWHMVILTEFSRTR